MNIKRLLFLILVSLLLQVMAKGAVPLIPDDSTYVEIRLPDKNKIAEYKDQKDFNYASKTGRIGMFQMIPDWLRDAILRLIETIYKAGSAELLLVIMLVFAIIAVILRVNDINPIALFRRRKRNLQPKFEIGKENIAEMNFPLLIEQAEKQGNFRHAVRFHYLHSLALLAGCRKIELRDGKTNREYLQEIENGVIRDVFRQLVFGFEFVWYGEFFLDENQYVKLGTAFTAFQKTLHE